jgi:hypothetical protein
MNTPLSLVQELRGIRGGQKHNQADLENLLSEIREARREWQEQVEQAQNLLHDLLGSVAELSGVQLPGMGAGDGQGGDSSLRLGVKTLKDRIRNELEGYASASAAEAAKKVQSEGGLTLEPLEKEMSARMDNLAEEFRGKLKSRLDKEQDELANQVKARAEEVMQGKMNDFAEWIKLMTEGSVSSVPAEVEKSLQPHVEMVKDRLKNAVQQQLNMVAIESERAVQSKVEAIKNEVQSLSAGLSDQARQACSASIEQAMKDFESRLNLAVDEAARKLEESSQARTQESLDTIQSNVNGFADSQAKAFKERLIAAAQELQQKSAADIKSNVQKASQDALDASLAALRQRLDQTLEQSKVDLKSTMGTMADDVRKQMGDFALSARDSLAGDATRLSENLKNLGEELKTAEKQRITATVESMTELSRQTLEQHAMSVKQVADSQVEEIRRSLTGMQARMAADYEAQLRQFVEEQRQTMIGDIQKHVADASSNVVEEIKSSSGQVVQDLSGKVNKEVNTATTLLNQWAHQTTTWAEASIKESLESYKRQVAEITNSLLDDQRNTIEDRIGDLQGRLEQAASLLRVVGQAAPNSETAKNSKKS